MLVAASTGQVVLALVAASVLFLIWVVAVAALFTDTLSLGAKLVWFLALTVLAPVAIPVYFLARYLRHAHAAPDEAT
jgi:hypothetical protein